MTTLCVGDLHLKQQFVLPCIDRLLVNPAFSINRIVFLGDACDDWDASAFLALDALEFYADWVEKKREEGLDVDVLLGNHDFAYIRGKQGPGTIWTIMFDVRDMLEKRLKVQVATVAGGALCTHAGIVSSWRRGFALDIEEKDDAQVWADFLNTMLNFGGCWEALGSCGPTRGSWGRPGPLWADYRDMIASPFGNFDQIVGHTPMKTLTTHLTRPRNATTYFCDTMSLRSDGKPLGDGSMLLVEGDGEKEIIPFCGEGPEAFAEVAAAYAKAKE